MKKPFDVGSAIYLLSKINDYNRHRTDPDSINISIFDSRGTKKVDGINMDKVADGEYSYIYQSAIGDATGKYRVKVTASKGGYTNIYDEVVFALE